MAESALPAPRDTLLLYTSVIVTLSHRGRLLLSLGAILCFASPGGLLFGEGAFAALAPGVPFKHLRPDLRGVPKAELLVKGSWTAGLTASAGLKIDGTGSVALGDQQPLLFTQTPDLYISFLLFKKLFAEIRLSPDPSESKYSVGYRGGEGELLQEVRVGNDGIGLPRPPLPLPWHGQLAFLRSRSHPQVGRFSG